MLHIEKTRSRPALPPLLRGSNALPYDIFPSSPLHFLFSYLLSSLLSHFHPHTTYSLSFNYVLATFRLLRKARRLHSLLTKILALIPYLLTASSLDPLLPALSSTLLPLSFSLQPLFSYLLSPPLPPLFFLFLSTIRYIICFSHFSAITQRRLAFQHDNYKNESKSVVDNIPPLIYRSHIAILINTHRPALHAAFLSRSPLDTLFSPSFSYCSLYNCVLAIFRL